MAQYGRPESDVSATNFAGFSATTPGSFYTNIDESSADDSDYVYTLTTGASYECGLSGVSDPGVHTGHVYRWRVALSGPLGGGDDPVDYAVSLYQGATLIASYAGSVGIATVAGGSYTLSSGEAGSITDYTDLRLRFAVASATSPAVRFHWAELEVPDASSDEVLTPDPAAADAGANDPTPIPGGTILLPGPAPADAEGVDPDVIAESDATLTPMPAVAYARSDGAAVDDGAGLVLGPDPAYAVSWAVDAHAPIDGHYFLPASPAAASAGVNDPFPEATPTILLADPAVAWAVSPAPAEEPGGATLSPLPAVSFADAGGAEHADNGADGGRVLTPLSARAEAETPPDPTPDTPSTPRKRMAGCRCTCRLQLKTVSVSVRGCCNDCPVGALVQLLAGGVVVAEATLVGPGVSGGFCPAVFLSTTAPGPYEVRVSGEGYVSESQVIVFVGGNATASFTLEPEAGWLCGGDCGKTYRPEAARTLYDAKGNAISMSLDGLGVYRGTHSYHVDDRFIDPCVVVWHDAFGRPRKAYEYPGGGLCFGTGAPPVKDFIGPGDVTVSYFVEGPGCGGSRSMGASWPMWSCRNCGCFAGSNDLYVPPMDCFGCGDGNNICLCGWPGAYSGGSFQVGPSSVDCDAGERMYDVPFYINPCFPGAPSSTSHHPLGGSGIYTFV